MGSNELAKVLGLPYPHKDYYQLIQLTGELERILLMLAGPHGKIIRKALEARNAYQGSNPKRAAEAEQS
jgi:hypothetical protein